MPSVDVTRVMLPLTPPQAVGAAPGLLVSPVARPAWATAVLAHSAGSGHESDVLTTTARALAGIGVTTLSFAFAYRAAGRRMPDPAARLLSAWRDALAFAGDAGPAPVLIGGRSMGGRYASMLAAEDAVADGLILLAYPLTPRAGGTPRTAHWPSVRIPSLFVTGERDALCDLDLLARERPALTGLSELVVLAGADHSFDVRTVQGRTRAKVLREAADAVTDWTARRFAPATSNEGHR